MAPEHHPVACSLDPTGLRQQLGEWGALAALFRHSERHGRGASMWFDAAAEPALREVAAKEADCCRFLDLHVEREGDAVRLDISSDSPEAESVIGLLVGQASGT